MRSWIHHAVRAACLAAMLLAGCDRAAEPPALRIAVNPWPGYEFLSLAERHGLYARHGVTVRLVEFASLHDALRAYELGHVDGLASTLVEVAYAQAESDRRPQVVVVADHSNGADVIVAHRDVPTVAALRGKRIGVELRTVSAFLLSRALETVGLSLEEVQLVPLEFGTMVDAFDAGEVDAVVSYSPTSDTIREQHGGQVVFSSREIPGELLDTIAVDARVVASRPDDVRALVAAFFDAVAWWQQHPDEGNAFIGTRIGLDGTKIAHMLAHDIRLVPPAEQHEYLRSGGRLERVFAATVRALHGSGMLAPGMHGIASIPCIPPATLLARTP